MNLARFLQDMTFLPEFCKICIFHDFLARFLQDMLFFLDKGGWKERVIGFKVQITRFIKIIIARKFDAEVCFDTVQRLSLFSVGAFVRKVSL